MTAMKHTFICVVFFVFNYLACYEKFCVRPEPLSKYRVIITHDSQTIIISSTFFLFNRASTCDLTTLASREECDDNAFGSICLGLFVWFSVCVTEKLLLQYTFARFAIYGGADYVLTST